MNFTFTTPKFDAISFDAKAFRSIGNRALRAIGARARTQASRSISGHYNIGVREVADAIRVLPISSSENIVKIRASGRPIPIFQFVKTKISAGKGSARYYRAGIKIEILRGQQKYLSRFFFAQMPSGHVGIFKRQPGGSRRTEGRPTTSSANLPIDERFTLSIADMFGSRFVGDQLRTFVDENFSRLLEHEIEYYLRGGH